MGPKVERWLQDCPHRVQWTLPPHRKPSYRKNGTLQVKDVVHELPVKLWNVDTTFGRAGKFINDPANLPTICLNTT